jgi:parvulin-like peptidyl-prolyl isomerase
VKLRRILISAACAMFLASSHANATLIDAVSVVVDNEPITIYEIYALSKQFDIQTKEALNILIRQKLELSQIKTMGIQVSDYDVNQQINEIAAKNNLSVQAFYNVLKNEGITPDIYKAELKQKMQQEKLYQYVLSSKFQAVSEDELLLYYNKNQQEFTRFDSFDVIKFESQNAKGLENIFVKAKSSEEEIEQVIDETNSTQVLPTELQNYEEIEQTIDKSENKTEDLAITDNEQNNISQESSDANVQSLNNSTLYLETSNEKNDLLKNRFNIEDENVVISSENIASLNSDSKIVAALSQTDANTLTPIVQTRDGFIRFFVEAKNNKNVLPFEQVKNFIMSKISSKQENDILKEYFDMLKSRATITIIRLP